ncbi:MAG TPA: hypothetical protein VGN18_10110 [Jatrophihabitans sp.]|jgi:DNA gyrase subunit B|uniref:hypothetical protein n=1 Tax=Jatrophihabitans sp. TaxID=1932789 RepID=UPI002E0A6F72|nr:hypothetical protein [Jatrophihabitans sp.]
MDTPPGSSHDWSRSVDRAHLRSVRRAPSVYAPEGLRHLALEVIAYAADEAEPGHSGGCVVTLHPDGSIEVADDGRGTDTRADDAGRFVKKPVMSTKDLRFFDAPGAERLPDGHPRRGMSVVAALSDWLEHTNRRRNGSWTQRYERGVPVTDLVAIPDDGTHGTTVRFRADGTLDAGRLAADVAGWPHLRATIDDRRG